MCPGPSPKVFSVRRPFRRTARTRVRVASSSSATRRSCRFALRSPLPPVAAKFGKQKKIFSSPLAAQTGWSTKRRRRRGVREDAARQASPSAREGSKRAPRAHLPRSPPLFASRNPSRRHPLSLLFSSLHCVHLSVCGPPESAARPSRPATRREVARCSFSRTPGPRTPRGAHARTLGAYLPMPLPTVSVAHLIFLAGFNDD